MVYSIFTVFYLEKVLIFDGFIEMGVVGAVQALIEKSQIFWDWKSAAMDELRSIDTYFVVNITSYVLKSPLIVVKIVKNGFCFLINPFFEFVSFNVWNFHIAICLNLIFFGFAVDFIQGF